MANSFWRFTKGIVLNGETTNASDNIEGSLFVNSSDSRIRTYIQGALREITTNDQVQTLTNKTLTSPTITGSTITILDTNFTIQDDGDPTKQLKFQASGITSGQTRTLTAPDASTTIVGTDATQTLTNKVLSGNTAVTLISGSGTLTLNTTGTITLPNATDTLVGKATTDTLTNKTLTGNTAVNLVSGSGTFVFNTTGTITAPNATDTLVGKATTDTLTNKTLTGNTAVNLISGSGTMILNTTGTITLPNATDTLVGKATTDTLTNKTINGASNTLTVLAATQLSGQVPIANGGTGQSTATEGFDALAPTTTTGDTIYHNGTDNVRLAIGSANQVYKVVGGIPSWATFSGGINYLSGNPDAEANSTTGWATYADAAATSPVDGTGGSPSSTFTASSSAPLRGTYSFLWTKSANNRQGEGFSYNFTIDSADKAKIIQIAFDETVVSGTYADNDMSVWVYDVTNSLLTQVAPYNILNVATALPQKWIGTFQTASNSTSYRLIVHTASTSALAYTLKFDNFIVGPQITSNGPPISDLTAYTPTTQGFGTETAVAVFYARRGNMLYVQGKLTTGTVGGSEIRIGLPAGLSIASTFASLTMVGTLQRSAAVAASNYPVIANGGLTYVNIGGAESGTGNSVAALTAQNGSTVFNNTETETFWFEVPIAGWSSTVLMSNDASTRVVAFAAAKSSSTQTLAANTRENLEFTAGQVTLDTHAAWDATNFWYLVPVPGRYRISIMCGGANAGDNYVDSAYNLNGGTDVTLSQSSGSNSFGAFTTGGTVITCVAGDKINPRVRAGSGDINTANFTVERISGPEQIASTETVAMRYTTAAGQSIGNGTTDAVTFGTKDFDTHGAYSGATYTVPIAGKYEVSGHVEYTSASFTNTGFVWAQAYRNGSEHSSMGFIRIEVTQSTAFIVWGTTLINCVAGDTLQVRTAHAESTARSLSTNADRNWIAIKRIGN